MLNAPTSFSALALPWRLPERMIAAALGGFVMMALVAMTMPARAADKADEIANDMVVLTQSTERWVETSTPKVMVNIDAAFEEKSAASVREELKSALSKLVKADWRFVSMNRHQDNTGLERWRVTAEARVPDSKAVGLYGKARSASRTGLQLKIGNISYEPTRAELEKAQAEMRSTIYADAMAELARLNKEVPGRNWRIGAIDFTGTMPVPSPQPRMAAEGRVYAMAAMDKAAAPAGLSISQLQVLQARIVLMSAR